jgi:[ribosomal protein S5]-alanine N-acetyltransferase
MNKKINEKIFNEFPELESERLIFRKFEKADKHALFSIRSDQSVMNFMDSPKHVSIQDSISMIEDINISFYEKTGINWAIIKKSSNEFIGYFGFWRLIKQHCRAEIGYTLKPEFSGKGFMKEAFDKLIDFGFNNLQVHSIEANVNPKNIKSIRLLEKKGFRKEAHFRENYFFEGNFLDSFIYCLIETDIPI